MQLGWVDYSNEERNKVVSILRMLGVQTALDEIGVGTVRDSFADKLFPGISTIQTRAKYFVLLPYLFGSAEKQRYDKRSDVLVWINRQEEQMVNTLVMNSKAKADGIIGSRSYKQGRTVKQKPSGIYWNGLRAFDILRYPNLSIENVCDRIWRNSAKKEEISLKAEGDMDGPDDSDALNDNFSMFSPIIPEYDYMDEAAIDLTRNEALFLFEKITRSPQTQCSLLKFMLTEKVVFNDFQSIDAAKLTGELRKTVQLAQHFADFIYGAHILYNVIYSEEKDLDMIAEFKRWMRMEEYRTVDLAAIVGSSNCPEHTRRFLYAFHQFICDGDIEGAKNKIVERERFIKHDRAKLLKPQEYRYEKAIHNYKLSYRYETAKTIIADILQGMGADYGTAII